MVSAPDNRDDQTMATRRLVTRSKGRLQGIRSALRVALFPVRLQPLPVTAPVVVLPRRRGRSL